MAVNFGQQIATISNPNTVDPNAVDPSKVDLNSPFKVDTTGAFNFDSAVRRRLDSVDQIGQQQNQFADQQASQATQQRIDANRVKVTSSDSSGVSGSGVPIPNDGSLRGKLVAEAASFSGTPYVWGGSKPGGFDCSGLVQYAYGQMGVKMPRVSQAQAQMGQVKPIGSLQPGDLVGWGQSPSTAHHIAIYAGNGMVWEAPQPGQKVQLRKLGNWSGDKEAFGVALNI